jgi:chromosome segregation ATPase
MSGFGEEREAVEGKSLEERVTLLENELRGLPDRVGTLETQVTAVVLQAAEFREEVRAEFSSVRGDLSSVREEMTSMRDEMTSLRGEMTSMRGEMTSMRDDMTSLRGEMTSVRGEMTSMRGEMTSMRDELRKEINDGDDETRRLMRVLHEDLVGRISLIDKG